MSTKEKILDDLARLAGGTVGILNDAGKQMQDGFKARIDEWAQNMDLVPREDFERLEVMLKQSREEQESLKERIQKLEEKLDTLNSNK